MSLSPVLSNVVIPDLIRKKVRPGTGREAGLGHPFSLFLTAILTAYVPFDFQRLPDPVGGIKQV